MTWLALLLLGVSLADLVAAARPRLPAWVAPALGSVVVAGVALLSFTDDGNIWAVGFIVAALVLWRVMLARGETDATSARRALAALVLPAGVLLALSGWASPVHGPLATWLQWIDLPFLRGFSPDRTLLLVALALANTTTANHVVRLVLVSIHARPPRRASGASVPTGATTGEPGAPASEKLRGGRLLGPMERLMILGLGAAGYVAAAGLVVAAKGLLRFPELQAAARNDATHVDEVTEYFLVGTFTSLLVALASVVLLA